MQCPIHPSHEGAVQFVRRVTLIGAICNIILAIVKILVGIFAFSQALIADGVHSFSDLISDAAIWVGVRFWAAPPDAKHPYGHGRLETFVNLIIGILLGGVAVGIGWRAVVTIGDTDESSPGWIAFFVALVSILAKEILYQWTVRWGKRIRSSAVIANAWHHRSDALSSVPVAVAVLGMHFFPELTYLDHLAALIVCAMLLKATWNIVIPCLRELMENVRDQQLEQMICQLAEEMESIEAVHAIRSRRMGGAVLVDMHMLVVPNMTVETAHDLAGKLKAGIIQQSPQVLDVLIHIEPYLS